MPNEAKPRRKRSDKPAARTVGTKLQPDDLERLEKAVKGTSVHPAVLMKVGLMRVLAEFERTGSVVMGEPRAA
jgi:hypothetical protein